MQVYQGKNYATGSEIADVLGMGDQHFRNQVKAGKLPRPSVTDTDGNRRYYAPEYIVPALMKRLHRETAYLTNAVIRLKANTTLTDEFKQKVIDLLEAEKLWPHKEMQRKQTPVEADERFNPIRDVLSSPKRGKRMLSPQDIQTLQRIKRNPPKPTTELVSGLREIMTGKP